MELLRPDFVLLEWEVTAILEAYVKQQQTTTDQPQFSNVQSESSSADDGGVNYSDDDPCWVIFTSGSTGTPKAVVATCSNLLSYVDHFVAAAAVAVPPEDDIRIGVVTGASRILLLSNAVFDPSIGDIFSAAFLQCGLITASRDAIESRLSWVLQQSNATHVVSTPALWATMQGHDIDVVAKAIEERSQNGCDRLRVFLGGERTPPAMKKQWAHIVTLFNIYGVTEATIYQTLCRIFPGHLEETSGTVCGRSPSTALRLRPLDAPIDGSTLSCSNVGELMLGGPQVCKGYFNELAEAGALSGRSSFRVPTATALLCMPGPYCCSSDGTAPVILLPLTVMGTLFYTDEPTFK